MSFNEATKLYRDVYKRFEKIEKRPWGVEGAVMELTHQVGTLALNVMKQEKYYFYSTTGDDYTEQIADEIADVFGQIIRIADYYQINLLEAHIKERNKEVRCLEENKAGGQVLCF